MNEKAVSLRTTFRRSGELFYQIAWKSGSLTEVVYYTVLHLCIPKENFPNLTSGTAELTQK